MVTKKEKQHYVPKFYLRHFSYQSNQKEIGVFNIRTKFFIQRAPLRTQAYKPFFYRKDGVIEDTLSSAEGVSASLIRKIIEDSYVPKPLSEDHALLLFFVLLSQLRNPVIARNANQSFDNLIKTAYGKAEMYKDIINGFDYGVENASSLGLSKIDLGMQHCNDLEVKLIKNKTKLPFITSDNPVVKYNQFLESRKWEGGITGFASLGLQVFVPLNAENLILFYDPWIYRIGSKKQRIIYIDNKKDIEQINLLHFLNCEETIFFDEKINQKQIEDHLLNSAKFEKANQVRTKEYRIINNEGKAKETESIIRTNLTDCQTKLHLTFIKQTVQAKIKKLDNRAVQLRKSFWKR